MGAIAGKVDVLKRGPVGFLEPLRVTPDAAQHRWPRFGDNQETTGPPSDVGTGIVHNINADSGNGDLGAARLGGGDAGQSTDHDGPSFGLPPGVDDGGDPAPNDLSVPHPCFGVDGFSHRTQQAKRRQVKLLWNLSTQFHKRSNSGGGGVENGDPILLDDFPPTSRVRGIRCSLVNHLGGTVS